MATVVSTEDYYPFGATLKSTTTQLPAQDKFKYQGKERDQETGYDYFEARLYDSQLGRFMQVDPLWEKFKTSNAYVGMGDNPIQLVDPDGMANTNFYDENGTLTTHIDDGSNAKFQVKGEDEDKHYEFTGYEDQSKENQKSEDKVNIETAIQEAQNLNMKNTSLQQKVNEKGVGVGVTHCNQATRNILKTVGSALKKDLTVLGDGNEMSKGMGTSSNFQSITIDKAREFAKRGELVVIAWEAPKDKNGSYTDRGHLATFSVGKNQLLGEIAKIGPARYTGFVKLTNAYSKDKIKELSFYKINEE